MIGSIYKLLWSGDSKPENGVGVIVANWLVEKIVEIERPSGRIMKAKVVIVDNVWEVVSCYCPHIERATPENDELYELLDQVVSNKKVQQKGYY